MDYYDIFISILASTIRLSIPLIFTALAGLFSERAGIFDIGLEGKMLGSAFAAACVAYLTDSAWLGLGAWHPLFGGAEPGAWLRLDHQPWQPDRLRCRDQLLHRLSITIVLGQAWFGQGGRTPQLSPESRFAPIILPGADTARDIPIIGPIYANVISGNNVLTYLAFLAVPFSWWVLYRTRFGLRLRAVGENPGAVDTVKHLGRLAALPRRHVCGHSLRLRLSTYLAIAQSAAFIKDMSVSKGYIALAALVFAKWKPVPVMFACLLFGFLDALANFMQGKQVPLIGEVPVQVFQALPYVLTCVLLAGFIGVATPPKAGGVPYTKER